MATVYFAGGEDVDLFEVGGGTVSTNSQYYRTAYARCGLLVPNNSATICYWQNWIAFTASTFWTGARIDVQHQTTVNGCKLISWLDSSNIERVRIIGTGTDTVFQAQKVDASNVATNLGSTFVCAFAPLGLDKFDVFMHYAVSGTFTVYLNGIQQFTFSGDVTTNSVASLSNIQLGTFDHTGTAGWSEIIVTDTDSRSMSLQTLAPVANGNTHNFDTGSPAAANVNEVTLNDATLDGSTTAGQIDEYTIPTIAAGTYTILGIGVSARMQKGSSGPSKMDLAVRSGGTDYFSADQVLTLAWVGYQNWWATDPNTSGTWTGLPTNIGLKSVT